MSHTDIKPGRQQEEMYTHMCVMTIICDITDITPLAVLCLWCLHVELSEKELAGASQAWVPVEPTPQHTLPKAAPQPAISLPM